MNFQRLMRSLADGHEGYVDAIPTGVTANQRGKFPNQRLFLLNSVQLKNLLKQAQKRTIPLERAGNPHEVARVAGFLASGFSSYVNGMNMVVDGGAS